MQPEEFLKQIKDNKGYLRTSAIDIIERISNKDSNTLMQGFEAALSERAYSPNWQRTDKIKHVLRYMGPSRPLAIADELQRLDGGQPYTRLQRAAVCSTLGVLFEYGKLSKTYDKNERPLYSL